MARSEVNCGGVVGTANSRRGTMGRHTSQEKDTIILQQHGLYERAVGSAWRCWRGEWRQCGARSQCDRGFWRGEHAGTVVLEFSRGLMLIVSPWERESAHDSLPALPKPFC
jgi:hypothetical protein